MAGSRRSRRQPPATTSARSRPPSPTSPLPQVSACAPSEFDMDKRFVVALAAVIVSFAAAAGLIHVKPTTLVMPPGQSAAVLTVTNNGDTPINAQVRVFAWDQVQGK